MQSETLAKFSIFDWGVSPWLLLLLALVPLLLLMKLRRTYPTPRLALLLAIPFCLAIPLPWLPSWWWYVVLLADVTIVVIAVADVFTLPKLDHIEVSRQHAARRLAG